MSKKGDRVGLKKDFDPEKNRVGSALELADDSQTESVMTCKQMMEKQKQALIDMMRGDEEIGLYDDDPENHGYE